MKRDNGRIHQIPLWEDNYIYLLEEAGEATVIDPGEFETVQNFLIERKLSLKLILNTHHHFDHVGGNQKLKESWNCPIYAPKKDAHRIPGLNSSPAHPLSEAQASNENRTSRVDQLLNESNSSREAPSASQDPSSSLDQGFKGDKLLADGEEFSVGSFHFKVLFTPGHTSSHIVFWDQKKQILFCGDTLFAMGCGRLFEGSPKQMFESLSRIKELPPETLVYCAHEYTLKNAKFALSIEPHNKDLKKRYEKTRLWREKNQATIPFLLKEELLTNPFLRAKSVSEFASIRKLRDQF